ncbi:hypothetical protein N9Y89_00350 [bacterium]|nr:hypothetical protein [bacterium]
MLNPQAIIFCGNISKSLDAYMDVIKISCEEQLLSDFRGQVYYVRQWALEHHGTNAKGKVLINSIDPNT